MASNSGHSPASMLNSLWLTTNCQLPADDSLSWEQSSNLLLALPASILGFRPWWYPWPYFCLFQDYIWVLKQGLLFHKNEVSDYYCRLSLTVVRVLSRAAICCWSLPAQSSLVSGLIRTNDHVFVQSKTSCVFWNGVSSLTRGVQTAPLMY
jgi:hypothetical protein